MLGIFHQSTAGIITSGAKPSPFTPLFLAGEGVHPKEAVPAAGGRQGRVHPGNGRRVEGAEDTAAEARGGVRQGRQALVAGPRRHGPAVPPGEPEDGDAEVPAAGRQVEQDHRVGALQPQLPVSHCQGPRVSSPELTVCCCSAAPCEME